VVEVVFQFVHHLRERYGDSEVKTWLWEVWNEPDIDYWQGTAEEYFKLYDFSVDAVLRALPQAGWWAGHRPRQSEGGRAIVPRPLRSPANYVSGKTVAAGFHQLPSQGSPKWQGDHVQMGIARQLAAIEQGFKIVASFPEWRRTPIILGESDPEGCAACSARTNPQNSYRNGPLYAAYTAETLNNILFLASRERINFLGAVTWAFEFENQPYFEGFRTLATNGVDKPVLNAFRMFGLLGDERITATSSGTLPSEDVIRDGVRGQPDINVISTRKDHEVEILIWNYHDDDLAAAPTLIDLALSGLPARTSRGLLEHFRVDASHSNAFAVWKNGLAAITY
jgi:xylan 1,4-beta-xylosidase